MVILDVRSKDEFESGHVQGAVWFPVERLLGGKTPDLAAGEEIATYCRSGTRAEAAKEALRAHGFTNVRNAGGLADMAEQGYQIV